MDVSVALGMYSLMITVITLLGALFFSVARGLLTKIAGFCGRIRGWLGLLEMFLDSLKQMLNDVAEMKKNWVEKHLVDAEERKATMKRDRDIRLKSTADSDKIVRPTKEKLESYVSYLRSLRDAFTRLVFMELTLFVGSIVILLVLLLAIDSPYWEYSVGLGWGIFLIEIVTLFIVLRSFVITDDEVSELIERSRTIWESVVDGWDFRGSDELLRKAMDEIHKSFKES